MSADPHTPPASVDLDDADGLLAADREGLLRGAAMAGAQMRATAAALVEGELDRLRSDLPPRAVAWVAGHGAAEAAGAMLAAGLGGSIVAPIVVASEVPPWVGALDVVVVAGDDAGDPALITAASTGIRRGARVIVVAPEDGPLRDVAEGRSVVLTPRLRVADDFGLIRYLSAGLAVLHVVDPGTSIDLSALADELDAEALRDGPGRAVFTNPAKTLADRMSGRSVVLAGDSAATLALARHCGATLLRVALVPIAAVGLVDAMVALRGGIASSSADYPTSLFHDEEIDGPLPARVRTVVLTTDENRAAILTRLAGYDDVDVVSADDVPDAATPAPPGGRPERQLALMAVRLDMTAVYLRLARG